MIFSLNFKRPINVKQALDPIPILQKLAPPQAIIHIGAGTGNGEMHRWRQWEVPHALIIDADVAKLNWAEPLIAENSGWHAIGAIMAETESESDYHQVTNPEEDGLIPAKHLTALWPNLRTSTQARRPTQRLDRLLEEPSGVVLGQVTPIWTFVDCLPALPILKGAGTHLDRWSVLWLRVLLQPIAEIDEGAFLKTIEDFLYPLGYRCIDVAESNHPAIGHALFVRDWQALLEPRIKTLAAQVLTLHQEKSLLKKEKDSIAGRQDALQSEVPSLIKAHEEQSNLAMERQFCIEGLTEKLDNYAKQATELQNKISSLTQANAKFAEEKSAAEKERTNLVARRDALQGEVTTITNARDEQAKLAAERQTQISGLTQTNAKLTEEKSAVEKERGDLVAGRNALQVEVTTLTKARDEQAKLAADRQASINSLTQERDNHAKQAAERQTQITVLTQANAKFAEEKSAVEKERADLMARRDALQGEVATLTKARDEQAKLAADRQVSINSLTQERDNHAKQSAERQSQISGLTQTNAKLTEEKSAVVKERTDLMARRDALQGEVTTLTKARDEQAKLVADRQNQINALNQAHAKFAEEKSVLEKERAGLIERRDTLQGLVTTLTQARDEQAKLASERQIQIDSLTLGRDIHAKKATERQAQIDGLSNANAKLAEEKSILENERTSLIERMNALQGEVATLTNAHDEQAKLASERQIRLFNLSQERDNHAKQVADRQVQIGVLGKTIVVLTDEKSALENERAGLVERQETLQGENATFTKARDEQTQLAAERQTRIDKLSQERDNHAKQAADRQVQIGVLGKTIAVLSDEKAALENERAGLVERQDTLQGENATLTKARDEQTQLAVERQTRIDKLSQERDNHAKQATQRQAQIDTLTQANAVFADEKSALEKELAGIIELRDTLPSEVTILTKARDEQSKLAVERKAELDKLELQLQQKNTYIAQIESELAEQDTCQRLLNEEMLRVEAQIDLVKDVLLREPGL